MGEKKIINSGRRCGSSSSNSSGGGGGGNVGDVKINLLTNFHATNKARGWAKVVAQLVERLHPASEVRNLNPVSGKLLIWNICFLSTVLKRRK